MQMTIFDFVGDEQKALDDRNKVFEVAINNRW
jgi:hypothetical protein